MKKFLKVIYWCSVTHILLFFFTISLGQVLPLEFVNPSVGESFYQFVFLGIPIAILLTLTGITKKMDQLWRIVRWTTTPFLFVISFFVATHMILTVGLVNWENQRILFRLKTQPETQIILQVKNDGIFGYGGSRIVKAKPFTPLFQIVHEIDTFELSKKDWVKMNDIELQPRTFPANKRGFTQLEACKEQPLSCSGRISY